MASTWTLLFLILLIASTCHPFPSLKKSPKQEKKEYDYDSDSRAVSSNVDLDTVDDAAYERIRHALHSLHARIGAIDDR